MNVAAVLLAAGASTRMGAPKQLIEIDGKSMLRRAAEAVIATGCDPVIVVLGANAEVLREHLAGLPIRLVINERWQEGMASSIRAGLVDTDAALITLCDQPFVHAANLIALIELFRNSGKPIAAARYGGNLGVPAIFARALFPELLALTGDMGARRVIAAHADQVAALDLPDAAIDLDTPLDVESYSAKLH
jgi:molybdenum cofactor cytidylyltransferase